MEDPKSKEFFEAQMSFMKKMMEEMTSQFVHIQNNATAQIPFPKPLQITGDLTENCLLFENNWNNYCEVTRMKDWTEDKEPVKAGILWSAVGDDAKLKYNDFHVTEEERKTAASIITKIKSVMCKNEHSLYERWNFYSCTQAENESFDNFLLRAKKMADGCQFDKIEQADLKNIMIRDRICFGIKDNHLKKKFLKENPEKLTLEEVIKLCQISETTDDRFKNMVGTSKEDSTAEIHKIHKKTEVHKGKCKFCNYVHDFSKGKCPAMNQKCNTCNKTGHFKSCCPSRSNPSRKLHSIEQQESSDTEYEQERFVYQLSSGNKANRASVELKLKFNGKWDSYRCDMDSQSDVCVVGYKTLVSIFGSATPQLEKSNCHLKAFGGSSIEVKGQILVPCRHKNQIFTIVFQVVGVDHGFLLSERACVSLGLIKYCNQISTDANQKLKKDLDSIINEFQDVFNGIGKFAGTVKLEIDKSISPVIQKARRIPVNYLGQLEEELKSLSKMGIIEKVEQHTDWVSNVLLVRKPGSMRICIDPKPLNEALKRPNYQFTTIDEILPSLGKARIFSTVDVKKGFWHVELDKDSSLLTTFWTPFGRYRWKRLPFGISSAPEIFQMKVFEMTHDLNGVEVMADDILVYGCGDTYEEAYADHNKNMKSLLMRCRENNCKLNKSKIVLCNKSVLFYGFVLSDGGLKPNPVRVEAIRNMPEPKTKEDVSRFLGMTNYLARFIPNLSTESSNLRNVCLKTSDWKWTKSEQDEFIKLKNIVSDSTVLKYFDLHKPVELFCDSSSFGLGAALFQDNAPIGFASRTLTKAESNYAMIEKELLAVLFGCKRFDQLLVGNQKVVVRTDHKPLVSIFTKPLLSAPKRLQAMLMALQRYNLTIEFISGTNNYVADTLSRAPIIEQEEQALEESRVFKVCLNDDFHNFEKFQFVKHLRVSQSKIDLVRKSTENDMTFQKLRDYINSGWPKHIRAVEDDVKVYFKYKSSLSYQEGIIFKDDQILIPADLRTVMLEAVHKAHNGKEFTMNLAKENLFWPGMTNQIEEAIRSCWICNKFAASQQKLPMQSHEVPIYPWQIISMDICFPKYRGKVLNCLVMVDHYSDFIEVDILDDLTTISTIRSLKRQFARYGVPEKVISDEGTHFVSNKMEAFSQKYGFKHSTSSAYHQQGNGKAESAVKIIKHIIEKASDDNEDFWWAILHSRNTPNKMQSSPAQRLMSRNTRCGLPALPKKFIPKVVEGVSEKIREQRENSKGYYDRFTKDQPGLDVGQDVLVQIRPDRNRHWTKGVVQQKVTDRSYVVEVGNTPYRRDRVHLKPAHQPVAEPSTSTEAEPDLNSEIELEFFDEEQEHFSTPVAEPLHMEPQHPARPQRKKTLTRKLLDYDLS